MVAKNFMVRCLGSYFLFVSILIINIQSFICGISLGWTSPVLPKLNALDDNPIGRIISSSEASWIGSLFSIGGMIGPFFFGIIMDKFGRKMTMIATAIPFVAGFLIFAFAQNIYLYYLGRILTGLSIGGQFSHASLYIAEISDDKNRGSFSSLSTSFILCGILFAYVVGPFTPLLWFNLIIVGIVAFFLVMFIPLGLESPYYHLKKGNYEQAEEILKSFRSSNDVTDELDKMKQSVEHEQKGSILDIFRTLEARKAFTIMTILLVLQQFSGINVILQYSQLIFESTGSNISGDLCSIIVGCVQVGTCLITPLGQKKVGKKPLLLTALTGVCIGNVLMGIYFYIKDDVSGNIGWLPLFSMIFYITFYNFGIASLPWVMLGELYPLNVKAMGSATSTAIYWFFGFLLTYFFNDMTDAFGLGNTFIFYGACCLCGFFFTLFFVFETRGKSFQEIQDILGNRR